MDPTLIGNCCQVGDGTHSTIERQDSGVLYLTSRNFKDGQLDLSKVYYISEQDYSKHFLGGRSALTKPQNGDLVFSIIGTIGQPYLVREWDRFGVSSSVAIVRPDKRVVIPRYLLYWFKGPVFQSALHGIKGGVAQGYVSLEMIRSLPLILPPLPIQRRIADILSAYDDLIEINQKRIRILEEMARSLYREWFVHFRYPGHEKVPLVESPMGLIPKGWGRVVLDQLVTYCGGGDWGEDQPNDNETEQVSIVRGTDFDQVIYGGTLRVPQRYITASSVRTRALRANDVIVENSVNAKSRCIGTPLLVDRHLLDRLGQMSIAASFCKVLRTQDPALAPLLYLHLRHLRENARMEYYQNVAANGIGNFQAKRFLAQEFLNIPTELGLRTGMMEVISTKMTTISILASKIHNLRRTRDLLLPRLMSGQLNLLPEVEA